MQNNWRLIIDKNSYADFSVSVSPAIERAVVEEKVPPTVYLNVFDKDSVTIGMNEDPEQTLNLEFCKKEGVLFRRRPNGGGPVYAGKGSAFLVYYLPTKHPRVAGTTAEAFPVMLTALANILADRYGFAAQYRPLNDVEVDGRKLIPASLKIENGVMTFRIIINVTPIDTELAGRIMPMPPEKVVDKTLKDMSSRYTCLENEACCKFDLEELEGIARCAVYEAFGEGLKIGTISDIETVYGTEFRSEYESDRWLFAKSERNRLHPILKSGDTLGYGRAKAIGGLIRATIAIRDGKVIHAIINGDWHPRPLHSVGWLEDALVGVEASTGQLTACVDEFLANDSVEFAGVEVENLMEAIDIALSNQKNAIRYADSSS
tara:strand:- start:816 stop:1940 length:1125 start_codon:yes stop_codon:yes gene_type:complete